MRRRGERAGGEEGEEILVRLREGPRVEERKCDVISTGERQIPDFRLEKRAATVNELVGLFFMKLPFLAV